MLLNIFMDDIRDAPGMGYYDSVSWERPEDMWVPARKVEDVMYLLEQGVVNNLSLDHNMGKDQNGYNQTDGYELVCWMEKSGNWPKGKITVHSAGFTGKQKMEAVLKANGK